jgi:hypothetical protein
VRGKGRPLPPAAVPGGRAVRNLRIMGALRPKPLLLAVLGLACAHAHQLVPAAGAPREPGNPRVAAETVEGVRLRVDSSAWREGYVRDALSPLQVSIDNGSDRPLRIAYTQFTLSVGKGFRLQALPPFQVAIQNATATAVPYCPWVGFWTWDGRFYDPGYCAGWGSAWPAALPDQTVLRHALPEGIVDPGGRVSGFLYFPDQPEGEAVTFVASLVDATTSQVFGTIEIPFRVK